MPVSWVDLCDAFAYCKWANRRLCGKIGGGINKEAEYANPALSQWMHACVGAAGRAYPYGDTFNASTCNTPPSTGPAKVASFPQCVANGYPGLYDMSGNLAEWDASCDATVSGCRLRGGAFDAPGDPYLSCDAPHSGNWSNYGPDIGFRCCGL